MSLVISEKTGGSFTPLPAGTHLAVCNMMVDEGTQYNENFKNFSHKIRVGWEIPGETIEVDGEQRPRMISKEYTASLSTKANLRKDLESWRGRAFTPEELKHFDLKSIVGAACMLSVIHTEYNGSTYAKVSGVMAVPKGIPKPGLSEPPTVFELSEETDFTALNDLPEWLAKIIMNSKEYLETLAEPPEMEELPPEEQDELDSIPF